MLARSSQRVVLRRRILVCESGRGCRWWSGGGEDLGPGTLPVCGGSCVEIVVVVVVVVVAAVVADDGDCSVVLLGFWRQWFRRGRGRRRGNGKRRIS